MTRTAGRVRVRGGGLLGRADELSGLRRLLARSRLVTVTGGPGVGKSMLAAHAAAAVNSQLTDGVIIVRWWDGGPARGQSVARAVLDAMDGEPGGESGGAPDEEQGGAPAGAAREVPDGKPGEVPDEEPIQEPGGKPDGRPGSKPGRGRDEVRDGEPIRKPSRVPDGEPDSEPNRKPDGKPDGKPGEVPDSEPSPTPGGKRHGKPDGASDEVPGGGPGFAGHVFGVVPGGGGPRVGAARATVGEAELLARVRGRRVLLVLDDLDPVREECVRLVQTLLLGAPGVRVLATGRQPLGLGQELVLHLRPLPVGVGAPGTEEGPGPAVELFLERARGARRRADPGTDPHARPSAAAPDEAELRAVRDICARLEGVPLAVELAAAQTALHSPARLAPMLRLTQGWLGRPQAPVRRHRSLRAAVGASYALCGQDERSVWARLSVFPGEFDEDAAVHVCAGGGLDPARVPSCLARLALASVLEPVRDPGGVLQPRYRLPAAARGFGAERLESAGESAAAAARHLDWYRTVAATAHQLWSTGRHEQATLLLRDEEPNLRTALERGPDSADRCATALGMVVDLWFWWAVCGHAAEGREHLRRLLPLGRADTVDGPSDTARGQALWLAGWLAACTGAPEAEELLGQAWRAAMLSGDDATIGRVAHVQGVIALRDGRTERAIEHLREAAHTVPVHADHGPPAAVSWAGLAVAQARVRPADALHSVRRASAGTQTRHDIWARSMTQYAHALVEHLRGRPSRAWRRAHKALAGVVSVAGPLGAASVHQLITAIEQGPAPGAVEWTPPCGWDPPGA